MATKKTATIKKCEGITWGKFFKYAVMISITVFLLFMITMMFIGAAAATREINAEAKMTYTGDCYVDEVIGTQPCVFKIVE